jgi:hypothetical protein
VSEGGAASVVSCSRESTSMFLTRRCEAFHRRSWPSNASSAAPVLPPAVERTHAQPRRELEHALEHRSSNEEKDETEVVARAHEQLVRLLLPLDGERPARQLLLTRRARIALGTSTQCTRRNK